MSTGELRSACKETAIVGREYQRIECTLTTYLCYPNMYYDTLDVTAINSHIQSKWRKAMYLTLNMSKYDGGMISDEQAVGVTFGLRVAMNSQ